MQSPLHQYFKAIRLAVANISDHADIYFTRPGKDFTRRRLLTAERTVWMVLSLLRQSLCVEIGHFFQRLNACQNMPSKSAFVQARSKIRASFFQHLFIQSTELFYHSFQARHWHSFRVWATDGTGFRLPNTDELGAEFGWHLNQFDAVPSTHLLVHFDVLNQIIVNAFFHSRYVAETTVACKHIQFLPPDVLMLYDRGFPAQVIPWLHRYSGSHCLVRLSLSHSLNVKNFVDSGARQIIVHEPLNIRSRRTLQSLEIPFDKHPDITYRLIRVDLPTGETEVLLTTLTDLRRFPHTLFKDLYHRRWGVETCFFSLKSLLQIVRSSAITVNSVWQDLYATFIIYNFLSAVHHSMEKEVAHISQRRRTPCQPNRNISVGIFKSFIVRLFLRPREDLDDAIRQLQGYLLKHLEPIKINHHPRTRKMMRLGERHNWEANYRHAL